MEITSDDIISNTKNGKSGYIKADQLFYFNKSKLDYYVFAQVDRELLDELIRLIIELRYERKLKMNIKNIEKENYSKPLDKVGKNQYYICQLDFLTLDFEKNVC